jgi:hypothetical protein
VLCQIIAIFAARKLNQIDMKRKVLSLVIFVLFLPIIVFAQNQDQEQYYLYNIIEIPSSIDSKNFEVKVDNGETIEKLKDSNGEKIKFKTRASVLMYFQSLGWEMAETTSKISGTSHLTDTNLYWIIRKPISKEEALRAAENAIKQ